MKVIYSYMTTNVKIHAPMVGMLKQQQMNVKNVVPIVNTVLKMLPILEDMFVNLAHQEHYWAKENV